MERKKRGVVYSPAEIAIKVIEESFSNLRRDRYPKIIDFSCGEGVFLELATEVLTKKYYKDKKDYPFIDKNADKEEIRRNILENSIYGMDISKKSVDKTISTLGQNKDEEFSLRDKIIQGDALLNRHLLFELSEKKGFDYVLGNPPYVGHKNVDSTYRDKLKEYEDVYYDKGDLSFCFIKLGIDLLAKDGSLAFITSRALVDSINGIGIRDYVLRESHIEKIVDFDTRKVFDGISVLSVILFLSKEKKGSKTQVVKDEESFYTNIFPIKNKWILEKEEETDLIKRIEERSYYKLSDVVYFHQGIITGLDKIFVVSIDEVEKYKLEKELIFPWVKNSQIRAFEVEEPKQFLIYSNLIEDEKDYPNAISYISQEKKRLEKRRECRLGSRRWYDLQWGRDLTLFQEEKIIFPYKAEKNRFAIDKDGLLFSADVYFMTLKNQNFTLEDIVKILNSEIYNHYYRLFAKKGVNDQYDYYPNSLQEVYIPSPEKINYKAEDFEKELKSYFQ